MRRATLSVSIWMKPRTKRHAPVAGASSMKVSQSFRHPRARPIAARASTKARGERMAKRKQSPSILLTPKDWTEIFYAVELKRMHVTQDNRENGRDIDGVDLGAWRRQMEHIAGALGPDGERMHQALT